MAQDKSHDDVGARDAGLEPAGAETARTANHGYNAIEPDVVITVFAPPVSECAGSHTWENAVLAFEHRFSKRYGNRVKFGTSHFFSPEFFQNAAVSEAVQQGAVAPVITLNGQVIQRGGKLSERVIREELEKLGVLPLE